MESEPTNDNIFNVHDIVNYRRGDGSVSRAVIIESRNVGGDFPTYTYDIRILSSNVEKTTTGKCLTHITGQRMPEKPKKPERPLFNVHDYLSCTTLIMGLLFFQHWIFVGLIIHKLGTNNGRRKFSWSNVNLDDLVRDCNWRIILCAVLINNYGLAVLGVAFFLFVDPEAANFPFIIQFFGCLGFLAGLFWILIGCPHLNQPERPLFNVYEISYTTLIIGLLLFEHWILVGLIIHKLGTNNGRRNFSFSNVYLDDLVRNCDWRIIICAVLITFAVDW